MASASLFDTERARAHVGKDLVLGPHRGALLNPHFPFNNYPSIHCLPPPPPYP